GGGGEGGRGGKRAARMVGGGGGAAHEPSHRHVAGGVVQGGEQPAQRRHRVRHRPAEHSTVYGVVERAHLDERVDQATQPGGECRPADVPVTGVGDHDDVGGQIVVVLPQQGLQRVGAILLLALDEDDDADRQRVTERPQSGDVCHNSGLVVGGAAPVEPAVALDRHERVAQPLRDVADGLDVVVSVEQHGRRPGRGRPAAHHGRLAATTEDPHVG